MQNLNAGKLDNEAVNRRRRLAGILISQYFLRQLGYRRRYATTLRRNLRLTIEHRAGCNCRIIERQCRQGTAERSPK